MNKPASSSAPPPHFPLPPTCHCLNCSHTSCGRGPGFTPLDPLVHLDENLGYCVANRLMTSVCDCVFFVKEDGGDDDDGLFESFDSAAWCSQQPDLQPGGEQKLQSLFLFMPILQESSVARRLIVLNDGPVIMWLRKRQSFSSLICHNCGFIFFFSFAVKLFFLLFRLPLCRTRSKLCPVALLCLFIYLFLFSPPLVSLYHGSCHFKLSSDAVRSDTTMVASLPSSLPPSLSFFYSFSIPPSHLPSLLLLAIFGTSPATDPPPTILPLQQLR